MLICVACLLYGIKLVGILHWSNYNSIIVADESGEINDPLYVVIRSWFELVIIDLSLHIGNIDT